MKFEFSVKKFIVLLLALVVVFIPTYVAIAYYSSHVEEPGIETSENTYLQVKDPLQNEYRIDSEEAEDSKWQMFNSMIKGAAAVSEIPENLRNADNMLLADYITVTTEKNPDGTETEGETTKKTYAFYFSTDKANCYFMNPDQKCFKISENDAKAFLSNELSNFLYKSAVTPDFTALGTTVPAQILEWNYLAAGGIYQSLTLSGTGTLNFAYKSGDTIPMTFSVEPTVCTVKVTGADGTVLFDASYKNLNTLSLRKNTVLTFETKASWTKTEGCEAYGEATYVFTANLTAPAEFRINTSEIYRGEFAVVSAINIDDVSKITFSSSEPLPYIPKFSKSGDGVVSALIPVSYGCSGTSYVLTFGYGDVSQTLGLTVKYDKETQGYRYGYKDSSIDVNSNLFNTTYTDVQVETYNKLVKSICQQTSGDAMFDGAFLDYEDKGVLQTNGARLWLGFARNVLIYNGKTSTKKSFIHTGLDYGVTSATAIDVPALNAGKVCYVGTDDVLGKFVVVDHGCGLRSWYSHLTDNSIVAVGDAVVKGQSLGKTAKTGATGFTVEGRIHIGLTAYDQPVAPYGIWSDGGIILSSFDQ